MADLSPTTVDAAVAHAQALTEQLCRQPSVTAQGLGVAEMADLTERLLREAGFATRQLTVPNAPPIVYGEQPGRSPVTLLLYNHYDVQPPEPLDLWQSPPFEPTVRDGKLYARGVSDDKGEIGVRLAAIHALRAADGQLPIGIRWIIEGEEEVGSPHFAAIIAPHAQLLQADGCLLEGIVSFTEDGRPQLTLGFKGLLYVQLEVDTLTSDAHSGMAPILPSAAWRLVQALATLRAADGRVRIPGFYEAVREPTPGERAALAAQPDQAAAWRTAYGVEQFVDGLGGTALRERLAFGPTCNIAGLVSGYTGEGLKTVLPARAMAKLDFRLVPDQDAQSVLAALQAHLGGEGYSDVRIEVLAAADAYMLPLDHPFTRQIAAITAAYNQGQPAGVVPLAGGTLPLLGTLQRVTGGLPCLSAPTNPSYPGTRVHAPNEHIRLADLRRAVAFTLHLLRALSEPVETG